MNAHFSNAVNAVAFTWGTQKTYHAAQFGYGPFDLKHEPVLLPRQFTRRAGALVGHSPLGSAIGDAGLALGAIGGAAVGHPWLGGAAGAWAGNTLGRPFENAAQSRELQRYQDEDEDRGRRLALNDDDGPAADMSPFWGGHSEPFEGDETGPEIDTSEDVMDQLRELHHLGLGHSAMAQHRPQPNRPYRQ